MKDHPILFKGDMVRAILDGTKTQTRRVIKPQPPEWWKMRWPPHEGHTIVGVHHTGESYSLRCPYGVPGDRLFVRESFWQLRESDAIGEPFHWVNKSRCARYAEYDWCGHRPEEHGYKKRPSIHMPRWACRLWLEVVEVRVERVQDISNMDVLAEGIQESPCDAEGAWERFDGAYTQAFRKLWDSINSKRGYSWESDPWVWAVTFKRIEAPE